MDLLPCPACNQPVSPEAKACPKCGHPLVPASAEPQIPVVALLAIAFGLLAGLGAFLPWVNVGALTRSGVPGDGYFVLGASVVAILVGARAVLYRQMNRRSAVYVMISGLVSVGVSALDMLNLSGTVAESGNPFVAGLISVGAGLFICFACGIVLTVTADAVNH